MGVPYSLILQRVKTAERFQQFIHILYYQEEFLMKETINGYTKKEAMDMAFKIGFPSPAFMQSQQCSDIETLNFLKALSHCREEGPTRV